MAGTETHYVEKSENDQLVVTDRDDVESLIESVVNERRKAVQDYLDQHVEATSPMVKDVSITTDFQGSRAVTITYDVLDDLRQLEFEGIHD